MVMTSVSADDGDAIIRQTEFIIKCGQDCAKIKKRMRPEAVKQKLQQRLRGGKRMPSTPLTLERRKL